VTTVASPVFAFAILSPPEEGSPVVSLTTLMGHCRTLAHTIVLLPAAAVTPDESLRDNLRKRSKRLYTSDHDPGVAQSVEHPTVHGRGAGSNPAPGVRDARQAPAVHPRCS
jgi:hypothetical protein